MNAGAVNVMKYKTASGIVSGRSWLLGSCVTAMLGCIPYGYTPTNVWLNNVASLGGFSPGARGTVNVGFINNTPFFAVFTYGIYDPLNHARTPEYDQYFADADHTTQRLERNSTSTLVTFETARVLSLGGYDMLNRLSELGASPDEDLGTGITFTDKLTTDSTAQKVVLNNFGNQTLELGTHFTSGSTVVYTFEVDNTVTGGIRVDYQVILPAD